MHRGEQNETFSIPVASIKKDLEGKGFPRNHTPQICNALRSHIFLKENELELVRTDGPPSLTSTTVVFHYRFKASPKSNSSTCPASVPASGEKPYDLKADPRWIAFQKLKGALKDVYRAYGGGEAYLKSLRSEFESAETR
jgi:hypothetical protein